MNDKVAKLARARNEKTTTCLVRFGGVEVWRIMVWRMMVVKRRAKRM